MDSYKFQALRSRLVLQLSEKGISSPEVLTAIAKVLRHCFVESAFAEKAYEDIALPITDGQTISQPYTVAAQTELLDIKPGMKVLEIGTGSGYQCAILCEMGARVFSIERIRALYDKASKLLADLGYHVKLRHGDGTLGWRAYKPYERILVTAGAPRIPASLLEQLAIDGRLVIPVGDRENQRMKLVIRVSDNEFEITDLHYYKFVPLIGKEGWEE